MKCAKQVFAVICCLSVCLALVNYLLLPKTLLGQDLNIREIVFPVVHMETKHGKSCLEENICKNDTRQEAYIYVRRSTFYDLVEKDINIMKNATHSERVVPNIVHYTWYRGLEKGNNFRFHHMLAVLSAHKFIKPSRIYFWHDTVPTGKYWEEINERVPELCLVYRKAPMEIRGRNIAVAEHIADVVRLEAVMEYGGMYFDLDVMVLKPLDPFLKFDVVMGYEAPGMLSDGIIIGTAWADFLKILHKGYSTWNYHSLPGILAKKYPNLIHTVFKSPNGSNYLKVDKWYREGDLYNWRDNNFAIHLWIGFHRTEHTPDDIKTWNTTTGEIFRYIYFGDWKIKQTAEIKDDVCIYSNLCKDTSNDLDKRWKYIRLPSFNTKLDSEVDLKVNINHEQRVVPNIVHFTWYGGIKRGNTFRFHHLIAILAVHKFVKPQMILFWHDMEPEGPYWAEVNEKVPELNLVYRLAPTEIRGQKVAVAEHLTDVVRLEAVMEYGGMYFDLDAIVVKSLDPLLKYDVTMGYETSDGLCNGIIIGKPWAEFFKVWHREYKTFNDSDWAYHSVTLPAILARNYPNLLHTESISLHRPNWLELPLLYETGKLYDWRAKNYAVHLWIRGHDVEHNAADIKTWNTTVGEIFRYIYYGDWKIKE